MFTGLVEGLGRVAAVVPETAGIRLTIVPPALMVNPADPAKVGDSVAINGCCLTIIEINAVGWSFQAGTETLSKTNLGRLQADDPVNLERALLVTARLGGHFVQGHVDGVGSVAAIATEGDWITMDFSTPPALARQMVTKGSVCVDGVSLTVVTVSDDSFRVALIPHTLAMTTLGVRRVGDPVNLETDILGKYVERLLAGR